MNRQQLEPRPNFWLTLFAVLISACVATGCSSDSLAEIKLGVTNKGGFVDGAEVLLESEPAAQDSAFGTTQEDGSCVLDLGGRKGIPPGRYKISVSRYETVDGRPLPDGEDGLVMKQNGSAIRKTYVFKHELKSGPNEITLKIEEGELEDAESSSKPSGS